MQIELKELLAAAADKPAAEKRDLGTQIVVLDRGFVYVGKVKVDGDFVSIANARNIRKWGTKNGLGQLVDGPLPETVLDKCGDVLAPLKSVIHFIACNQNW